jgi:hypothetical protein
MKRYIIAARVGSPDLLLANIKRRKLAWFGYVIRHDSPCETELQGTLEGVRRRGRRRKSWMNNVKEWKSLTMDALLPAAHDRPYWMKISVSSSSITLPPNAPDWSRE